MFRAFADVQTAEMLDLPRPELETGKPIVVACPMSDEQHAIQQELVARYDRIRSEKVDPREDNALAITTDGRKLALDARMLSATAPDFPGSKVNALVDNVVAVWRRTEATRGTQMIFCDMGVHPTPWGYSAYDEVIRKLVARGIPRAQIAAAGDADSDAKKLALFEKVRSGSVRVLIGSTQKMGTGTNVQKRLVALHHLDAPWKPAEVEQRDGRILRQKNENKQVAIYRYVTEGSFDAYMWQALETKARFISQVMTGDNAARRAEDVGGQELSYAEVKALASGNPAFLVLAEADAELQRLNLLKRSHADEQYLARRRLRELPDAIEQLSQRLSKLTADMETAAAHADDPITIGSRSVHHGDVIDVLGARLDVLPQYVHQSQRVALGVYRGLSFGLTLDPQFAPELYLEGAITRRSLLSREHHGPRAVLNALERLAGGYGSESPACGKTWRWRSPSSATTRPASAAPFPHDAYLAELTTLRDQLKAGLSGAASGARHRRPTDRCRTRRADQGAQGRPHHRGRAATHRKTPCVRRGAGHGADTPARAGGRGRMAAACERARGEQGRQGVESGGDSGVPAFLVGEQVGVHDGSRGDVCGCVQRPRQATPFPTDFRDAHPMRGRRHFACKVDADARYNTQAGSLPTRYLRIGSFLSSCQDRPRPMALICTNWKCKLVLILMRPRTAISTAFPWLVPHPLAPSAAVQQPFPGRCCSFPGTGATVSTTCCKSFRGTGL